MFTDPADGKQKIWSESNVSEDFDMALRLMLKGYIVRCVNHPTYNDFVFSCSFLTPAQVGDVCQGPVQRGCVSQPRR